MLADKFYISYWVFYKKAEVMPGAHPKMECPLPLTLEAHGAHSHRAGKRTIWEGSGNRRRSANPPRYPEGITRKGQIPTAWQLTAVLGPHLKGGALSNGRRLTGQ